MAKTEKTKICVIIITMVFLIGCTKPDNPQYRIIYESAQDAPFDAPDFKENPQKYMELYTKAMDGSDIKRLTYNSYWEHQADVSPDGQKIVCSIHYSPGRVTETDPGWEIAVMDSDGSNIERLTTNGYLDFGAHWNRDGTKIVYVSDSAHRTAEDFEHVLPQYDIYIMNADGSKKMQLTFAHPGDVNADPSFSCTAPSKIVYVHSEGLSGNFDLYTMDADGSNKTLLFEHTDELLAINDPMFSPDSTRIIFEAKLREDDGNPIYNIFSINCFGNDLERVTSDDGESDIIPQFSPDGKKICYFTYIWENGHTTSIRIANPDGSDEIIISEFPWEGHPSWVPHGEDEKKF